MKNSSNEILRKQTKTLRTDNGKQYTLHKQMGGGGGGGGGGGV